MLRRGEHYLTADLVARAVIAAAAAYGDDPVLAMTKRGKGRQRALVAAASGMSRAEACASRRASHVFGLNISALFKARQRGAPDFLAAEAAAQLAAALELEDNRREAEAAKAETIAAAEAEICAPPPPPPPVIPAPIVAPEVEQGPISRPSGPISASRGTPQFRREPEPNASPLGRRILEAIGEETGCTQGLATILDVKEIHIAAALTALQAEGLVEPGEMPEAGRRQQRWRAVPRQAAGDQAAA